MSRGLQPPPFEVQMTDKSGMLSDQRWRQFTLDAQRQIDSELAPADAPFVISTADSALPNAVNLGLLTTGYLRVTTAIGIATPSTTPTIPAADIAPGTANIDITGNAATATTAGSAPAGTLTGATLAANVLASSLTSVGTLTGGATGAGFTVALSTATITGTLADARLSANVPLLNVANTFTAAQNVSIAINAALGFVVVNASVGNGAGSRYKVQNDGGDTGELIVYGTGHATRARQAWLLTATAQPIVFGPNNTERGRIHSSGGFSWGDTTDPGATNLRVAGTSTLAGTVTLPTLVATGAVDSSFAGRLTIGRLASGAALDVKGISDQTTLLVSGLAGQGNPLLQVRDDTTVRLQIDPSGNTSFFNAEFRLNNSGMRFQDAAGAVTWGFLSASAAALLLDANKDNSDLRLRAQTATLGLYDAIFIKGSTGNIGFGPNQTSPTARIHILAGSSVANTAPLKFTSGALLTAPEAGAIEFLTDAWYGTITTGAARKTFAFLESPTFTGVPSGPTAAVGTNTTQFATTAFVTAITSAANLVTVGTITTGTWSAGPITSTGASNGSVVATLYAHDSATDTELLVFQRNDSAVRGSIKTVVATGHLEIGTTTNHDFDLKTNAAVRVNVSNAGVVKLSAYTATTYVAGDFYVTMDANGVLHRSAIGPGS